MRMPRFIRRWRNKRRQRNRGRQARKDFENLPKLFGKDGFKKFTTDRWAHLQDMSREEIEKKVETAFTESKNDHLP
jgi:hypothetical protein